MPDDETMVDAETKEANDGNGDCADETRAGSGETAVTGDDDTGAGSAGTVICSRDAVIAAGGKVPTGVVALMTVVASAGVDAVAGSAVIPGGLGVGSTDAVT